MACLDNLIGIKSLCEVEQGTSGLYIEDIGITADEAGMYINSEYANGETLIKDKISFASKLVSSLVSNHFSSHINTKSLISSQTLGYYQDSLQLKSGITDTYGGINLRLQNYNSYLDVFINSISLQVNYNGDIDVKVIDLNSGLTLDTITVTAEANKVVTKTINKKYSSNKQKLDLIIVYDTTTVDSNTTLIWNEGCLSCKGYSYSNTYMYSVPVSVDKTSTAIRSNLTNTQHTFGLSLNYTLQCSVENWICEIANLIALPILYKAGAEIMRYATMYSNRQTSDVNIDAERNKERLQIYEEQYNISIDNAIKRITLPKNDICFKCEEFVQYAFIAP